MPKSNPRRTKPKVAVAPASGMVKSATKLLEQRFNALQGIKDNVSYYQNLSDYVEFVDSNKALEGIVQNIENQRQADYANLHKIETEAENELKQAKETLEKLVSVNKINIEGITKDFQIANDIMSGAICSSTPRAINLENTLFDISLKLKESGLVGILEKFAETGKQASKIMGQVDFSPSLKLLNKEFEKIELLKKSELWDCWFNLKFIPDLKRKSWSEAISINDLDKEDLQYYVDTLHLREEISGNNIGFSTKERDLERCKNCCLRLHHHLMNELSKLAANNDEELAKSIKNPIPNIKLSVGGEKSIAQKTNAQNIEFSNNNGLCILKLYLGNALPITFKKDRAIIINYYFQLSRYSDNFKNYADFSDFAKIPINSDKFSKEIKAINTRVDKETNHIVKVLLEKGDNKKQDANLYRWKNNFV